MKNIFATVALFAISCTSLCATDACNKADAQCPANSAKVQAQATPAPAATAKDAPKAKEVANPAESATAKVTPAQK